MDRRPERASNGSSCLDDCSGQWIAALTGRDNSSPMRKRGVLRSEFHLVASPTRQSQRDWRVGEAIRGGVFGSVGLAYGPRLRLRT